MFLSELAADMLLRLSDEIANSCAERMAGDYEQNGVYERSRLTYLLLSSLMMDYIEVVKLEKESKLHEALVTGWGRLVRVFSGESFTYAELCQYCDRGRIPVQLKHMLHTVPKDFDENGILELPKAHVDNMFTVMGFVKDHLLGTSGDDPGEWFVNAGVLLQGIGEGLPPGTRLHGDTFILPKGDFRQERAYTDKGKLFDLD